MSILTMPNQSFRWLFAELIVVVLGVLIALGTSSWYEDSQRRHEEREILSQFRETLEIEVSRLKNRLASIGYDKEELVDLLSTFDSSDVFPQKSSKGIEALKSYRAQQFNFSVYEVLKSKGFDLISNEDIRLRIVNFYEIAYPAVRGMMESERLYVRDRIDFLTNTEFVVSDDGGLNWTPKSYDSLRVNVEFRNLAILKIQRLELYEEVGMRRAIDWGEEILNLLDQEI